ncbi:MULTISPECIES: dermonecrotic toxin domain-containing protein [unclassified Pseudomonas]|nr:MULTISPECIES: DUF6543 domain-containing protein [unclassified Pseudomonas]NWC92737.1 hypothetical protein [Pseudomonas sp. IPO3779]NWD17451.1 hypothetical protein [Pseudomonas sp. IPO3778]
MRIADFRPAANIARQYSFSAQPQPAPSDHSTSSGSNPAVRSRRDVNVVSLEGSNSAKVLVEKSDSNMAIRYALALADEEASSGTAERGNWNPLTVSNIAPYSTFGMAWSNFAQVLKAEPFATFARDNNIDPSSIRWYPNYGGALECQINGKVVTFHDDIPGWARASADLKAAANLLGDTFTYTGENSAPAHLIGSFYGSSPSRGNRLSVIGRLLNTPYFPSLPDSRAPFIELRQQTIQAVASLHASGQLSTARPAETPVTQVIEADEEVARLSAIALLAQRNEIRPDGVSLTSGYVFTPPERSTIGQTIKAFNNAFQAEAFLDFARTKNLDISNVCIDPSTGDLMVIDRPNRVFRKIATLNDQSGWAEVSAEIRTLAKQLGEGTNELVPYNLDGSISIAKALSFYGEPPAGGTLKETLNHSTALYHRGFTALNSAPPPTDERARAVQQKQLTAIQQLENPSAMQPDTSAPAANAHPLTQIARTQFAAEPNLRTVVANFLGDAVRNGSNNLDFDINQVSVATPDPDNPGQFKQVPLIMLGLGRILDDAPQSLAGSKLLDRRPDRLARTGTPQDVPLEVNMGAIEQALSELPLILNDLYKNAASEYWKKPAFTGPANTKPVYAGSHADLVSSLLRNNLRMAGLKQPGLDEEQRQTVDMVISPAPSSTSPWPTNGGVATFTFPAAEGNDATPNILITRTLPEPARSIVLLVEPSGKITPYDSMAALSEAGYGAPAQVVTSQVFDNQANILIARHLGDTLTSSTSFVDPGKATSSKTQLSEWLNKASDAERFLMSELSLELASFTQRNKGQTYNSDIPDIHTYIQNRFDALPADQKLTAYPAKDLEVVYVRPATTFTLNPESVQYERSRMSLTDMLLNNLSGLPRGGVIEVYHKQGNTRVPELEGDGVLHALFSTIDAGKNYPELLKRELLDEPTKKTERLSLFTQQVPTELKLSALELAIKGEAGFDTTGFRYIQEILKPGPGTRTVDGEEITIRPLAFERKADNKTDVVEGAYLIEPIDVNAGPHILYRPLISDAPLLQFPTRQALLEAIQKPGKLQNDTQAWMPDETTRQIYSGNGFTHPNVVLFGLKIPLLSDIAGTPTNGLTTDEPEAAKTLQQKLETGQLLDHLYDANAQNLAGLADRESTSNAESRWATLKAGGSLLLNAVLPFIPGPGAGYVGLALLLEGVREELDVLSSTDNPDKAVAAADLLLNLVMLLMHFKTRSARAQTGASPRIENQAGASPDTALQIEPHKARFRLGGPLEKITPLDGEIHTNVDVYNGKKRLNIIGHAEKPAAGQPARIVGENDRALSAQDILEELARRRINIKDYPEVRLLVCYSGLGGENSLATELHTLTNIPVKAFEGPVDVGYRSGVAGLEPEDIYKEALEKFRKKYPRFSDADIRELADIDLENKLRGYQLFNYVEKRSGMDVQVNWGTRTNPLWEIVTVDYVKTRVGPPKVKANP